MFKEKNIKTRNCEKEKKNMRQQKIVGEIDY